MARTVASVFLSLCLSTCLTAAVITTSSAGPRVRFTSPAATSQMRVQILMPNGDALFDSAWRDGSLLDWQAGSLANGTYRCIVMIRDLENQITQKESALIARDGEISIEEHAAAEPKVTLVAHDGSNGEIATTAGDLKFSFGDFLSGKETERMRLKANGDLQIEGTIRATKGIELPDGTVVASAEALVSRAPLLRAINPSAPNARLTPRPNFAPAFQFVVNDTGVLVGTTNPAFRLDVTGEINTATQYDLGGARFMHSFGTLNTFVGSGAGNLTMTGISNTALGVSVLNANTSGTANTGAGASALFNNTTGYDNTALGYGALYANVGGNDDTAVGHSALTSNGIGQFNTAAGSNALQANTGGSSNTAVGYDALQSNLSGGTNTAIGPFALNLNIVGSANTAVGFDALQHSTGAHNLAIGESAGVNLTNGDDNIDIANGGVAGEFTTTRIGQFQNRVFIAGIRGIATGVQDALPVYIDSNGQLGTAASSARVKFDVSPMACGSDGLMQLRPVTFRYLSHGGGGALQYGLIAEEVAEVYPEMVTRDATGRPDSIMYQFLAPMLLNEVQAQHRKIAEQQNTIDALARRLEIVESLLVRK